MGSKELGFFGESFSEQYLKKCGYDIVVKNFNTRYGEIDIICENKDFVVFVEVKLRNEKSFYSGVFSVTKSKIRKVTLTAEQFLIDYDKELQPRFDVISITTNNKNDVIDFQHIENAF